VGLQFTWRALAPWAERLKNKGEEKHEKAQQDANVPAKAQETEWCLASN
jgi:hypothetical protein